ncbi:MAG: cation-translocating P-type ATPase, partial [Candidatus Riflemargulisbacteria bacterium]
MKKTINLRIDGMSCASCVLHVENDIKGLSGVSSASVNLPLKRGEVTFETEKLSAEDIVKVVMKSGYKASLMEDKNQQNEEQSMNNLQIEDKKHLNQKFWKLIVTATLSAILLSISLVWKMDRHMETMMILSLVIILYGGREFFIKGIPDLVKGRPAMDTLVALGVGAAFIYSTYLVLFTYRMEEYFMDVAIITTFVLLGRYLEARAKGKAGSAIRNLLELSPKLAHRVMSNGETEDIHINKVQIGDMLRVKPGEKIPTDGLITDGYGVIDESMVTGESMPVDKAVDDKVIGAAINGNTAFTMVATKVGADTVLSQIVKMVQEAQMHKAPIQKVVDVVAGYFVWGVLLVAAITFVAWTIVNGGVTSAVFVPTVAVLIIACPCALGLATPISIVVGSGKGAQLGIIIKKTESLEKAHKITAITFDKTGTITKGQPEVQEFKLLKGKDTDAHEIALALEEHSEHPLSRSIISYAKTLGIKNRESEVIDFTSQAGFGLNGQIAGKK